MNMYRPSTLERCQGLLHHTYIHSYDGQNLAVFYLVLGQTILTVCHYQSTVHTGQGHRGE